MSYISQDFPIILERFALNYPKQARFGYELMPLYEAAAAREQYKVAHLGADHLNLEDFKRAYGAQAKRTQNNIKEWIDISVHRYTVESAVDRAELSGSSDLIQSSLLIREARLRNAYSKLMNSIEAEQVKDILDETKYHDHILKPTGADLWSDELSNPIEQIEFARNKIKQSIGMYPTKCVISNTVWQQLRFKDNLVSLLPNTSLKAGITPEDFAKIISVDKVVIADNMYQSENNLHYTWEDSVVLAYVPESIYSLEDLSFGITVRAPLGYSDMRDYFDESTTSDVTAIDERLGWAVANYEAGFLFKNLI